MQKSSQSLGIIWVILYNLYKLIVYFLIKDMQLAVTYNTQTPSTLQDFEEF